MAIREARLNGAERGLLGVADQRGPGLLCLGQKASLVVGFSRLLQTGEDWDLGNVGRSHAAHEHCGCPGPQQGPPS